MQCKRFQNKRYRLQLDSLPSSSWLPGMPCHRGGQGHSRGGLLEEEVLSLMAVSNISGLQTGDKARIPVPQQTPPALLLLSERQVVTWLTT